MLDAQLVLEDGSVFAGRSVGGAGAAAGELCFTTAMSGYEEAVTDPSYAGQVLTFSYPLVGNYGVDVRRHESSRLQACGATTMHSTSIPPRRRPEGASPWGA